MKLCESGLLLAILAVSPAAPASAGQLSLMIDGGRVTLIATDVTVGQILDEWARVGQTTVVNRDDLPDSPVTLQLTSVPEKLALDVILRSTSGYVATPRRAEKPGLSFYDRILVLSTSSVQRSPSSVQPSPRHLTPTPPLVPAEAQSSPRVQGLVGPAPEQVEVDEPQEEEQDGAQALPLAFQGAAPARETPRPAAGIPPGATSRPGIVTPAAASLPKPMPD